MVLTIIVQRVLALIYLAHASDVLENAFAPLSDEDYDVAMKRVRYLLGKTFQSVDPDIKKYFLDLDPEEEAMKPGANEVLWAVVAAYTK